MLTRRSIVHTRIPPTPTPNYVPHLVVAHRVCAPRPSPRRPPHPPPHAAACGESAPWQQRSPWASERRQRGAASEHVQAAPAAPATVREGDGEAELRQALRGDAPGWPPKCTPHKWPPDAPRSCLDRPRMDPEQTQDRPRIASASTASRPRIGPKWTPRRPGAAPRRPLMDPGWALDGPRMLPGSTGWTATEPRIDQLDPESTGRTPNGPRADPGLSCTFLSNGRDRQDTTNF